MGVHAKLYVVNTSGSDVELHVPTKDGWKYFNVNAGATKAGPKYKISSHKCSPLREFKKDAKVVLKKDGTTAWSSKWRYFCPGDGDAYGGVMIVDNPAGDGILVEAVNLTNLIELLAKYFGIEWITQAPEEEGPGSWTRGGSREQETDDPEE
jgi:hypothetical protein